MFWKDCLLYTSIHHRLAVKERLTVNDLHGETLMLMRRNWSHYVDMLRDDLRENHHEISIEDFDFYDVTAFNKCENNNCVLMAIENWKYVHPLLKILPMDLSLIHISMCIRDRYFLH